MTLETIGIILGFFGAFAQALNYAVTKDCQEKSGQQGLRLLVSEHLAMFSLTLFPFLFFRHYAYFCYEVFWYVVAIVVPYLVAQYAINKAIALSDASIVSPLMTVKVPILALVSLFLLDRGFSSFQYLAIVMIISLGWYYSSLSGRIRLWPLFYITLGCASFCFSDLAMTRLTHFIPSASRAEQIAAGITYEYIASGLLAIPGIFYCKVGVRDIWSTKWIAVLWLLSMVGIVGCFNLTGVVEGNIIQTLRSVIGVIIAYLFYRRYIRDGATFRKKLFISIGMFLAVALYYC